ncbi:signal peptidase I [Roseibium album]|uniref:signal peptidase I n=1 Tax=Roseibium album TaxID=311410 RepID=UPI003298437A
MSKKAKMSIILLFFAVVVGLFLAEISGSYLHRAKHYNIPASSMLPTLEVGDQFLIKKVFSVFGEKYSPNRGDVLVFWNDKAGADYVKRLIGLPGERIQVRMGEVFINDVPIERVWKDDFVVGNGSLTGETMKRFIETLPNGRQYQVLEYVEDGQLDNTQEYVVPEGHLFFMGDNRDNSIDSRVLSATGFVPIESVKGVAKHIYYSGSEKSFVWRFVGPIDD